MLSYFFRLFDGLSPRLFNFFMAPTILDFWFCSPIGVWSLTCLPNYVRAYVSGHLNNRKQGQCNKKKSTFYSFTQDRNRQRTVRAAERSAEQHISFTGQCRAVCCPLSTAELTTWKTAEQHVTKHHWALCDNEQCRAVCHTERRTSYHTEDCRALGHNIHCRAVCHTEEWQCNNSNSAPYATLANPVWYGHPVGITVLYVPCVLRNKGILSLKEVQYTNEQGVPLQHIPALLGTSQRKAICRPLQLTVLLDQT